MKRISKLQLAINLNRHLGTEVGLAGLGILIYGWFRYFFFRPLPGM
jgi:hypothetical protein